jgi:Flp pilus assembly protein TadG
MRRRGAVLVFAALALAMLVGFVALALDIGHISQSRTSMQNAVDAAALAAAQEFVLAAQGVAEIAATAADVADEVTDANEAAANAAREMARRVADLNGVYVQPATEVRFGKREYNEVTDDFTIQWGEKPYNVVEVTARRDNAVPGQPNSRLDLFFEPVVGARSASLVARATAYVEARDVVLTLDYSASMNDDSSFVAMSSSKLGKTAVEVNMDQIWSALVAGGSKFTGTTKLKWPATGFGLINSAVGATHSSNDDETIFNALGLGATDAAGKPLYPFPQEGKNSNGAMKGMPSATASKALWKGYINWVRTNSTVNAYGYRKKYGYRTLVGYLLEEREANNRSEDLWRTPHYPFHAMKDGVTLFTEYLDGLKFGDYVGLVTYDATARVESKLNEADVTTKVDLGSEPITDDYEAIDTIQRHKQAGHYSGNTGIGYGVKEARTLLASHGRPGTSPTILLITDGKANQYPSGWSMPAGFNWAALTDYDGDGNADYNSSDKATQYAFWEVKQALDAGCTIHTISVGVDADRALMRAIAHAGKGVYIDVPGGSTVAVMRQQMLDAFARMAANTPPPKLLANVQDSD